MVALIKQYQPREVIQAGNPVAARAPQSALGDLGEGLQDVSGMFAEFQNGVDTADAKAADSNFSELIRNELYGNETGFMFSQGGDSIAQRGGVSERLNAAYASLLDGLSPSARIRAEGQLNGRLQTALQNVDTHAAGQGRVYETNASNARIGSLIADGIQQPDAAREQIAAIEAEIGQMADANGWSVEQTAFEMRTRVTEVHAGVIERIQTLDPMEALGYLSENKDEMLGDEVARLERILVPLAREHRGREIGAAVASGLPRYDHNTSIEFAMGPNRPNQPDQPILETIGRSVEDVIGAGARVVVTSGQEGDLPQHGSNRHMTGNAADVAIYRPDGTQVMAGDPEMAEIARAAAANGALGIGWGEEYMGGAHIHIDLVPPGEGQANTWGSGGTAMRAEIVQMISDRGEAPTLQTILDISDPTERNAALSEYNLVNSIQNKETEELRQNAQDQAEEIINNGGNIFDAPASLRDHISAAAMNSLIIYQDTLARGATIYTDDQFYVDLATEMATNPESFAAQDPMTWRDKLGNAHYDYFMKNRTAIIAGSAPSAPTNGPTVSNLRTAASTALLAAGFNKTKQPAIVADFEARLLRWSSEMTEAGTPPTPVEVNERINQMLLPVVIDPRGLGNKQSGSSFEMDYDGEPRNPDDDLSPQDLRDGSLTINDVTVSNEMMEIFATGFNDRFGRAPTVQEMVDGLIASGIYQ